jgi:hypothetical protein
MSYHIGGRISATVWTIELANRFTLYSLKLVVAEL